MAINAAQDALHIFTGHLNNNHPIGKVLYFEWVGTRHPHMVKPKCIPHYY